MLTRHDRAVSFYYFTEVRYAGRYDRVQIKGDA